MIRVKTSVSFKGNDKYKEVLDKISQLNEAYVTIGVHEDAGKYTEGKDPPSVVEVALWNEFGTKNVPERSFMRSAFDENEQRINQWREEALTNMLEKGWSVEKGLEMIGFRMQEIVRNKILSNIPPPNSEATLAAKAAKGEGSNTLIATTLMLRSVTYKVVVS